jgi:hypothetical protein
MPAVHQDRRVSEPSTRPERLSPPGRGCRCDARVAFPRARHGPAAPPASVHFSAAVRDEAMRLARGFGQRFAVDVWCREACKYRLLEACRPRTARASGAHNVLSKD